MTSRRGLLYQGAELWRDPSSRQTLIVQLSVLVVVLVASAIYHFLLNPPSPSGASKRGLLDEQIAKVHRLFVYPVKSCAAVELTHSKLSAKGFEFDRRWLVVRVKAGGGEGGVEKLEKISLREEPRLTLIVPSIHAEGEQEEEEERQTLRLQISKHAKGGGAELAPIEVPLRPSKETLQAWPRVPTIAMWGDQADGREVQLLDPSSSEWKGTPSDWVSKFLGYRALLLQFDPHTSTKRQNFPIFKPPHDLALWDKGKREELERLRPIEFQDEYPLLVATQESVDAINSQISRAIIDPTSDGYQGPSIRMFDASRYAHLLSSSSDVDASKNGALHGAAIGKEAQQQQQQQLISVLRFRPNILLRGTAASAVEGKLQGYSEDSWERFWIEGKEGEGRRADVALVARCKRCLLTTVDPVTAEKDPSLPLAFLRRSRNRDKTLEGEKKMGPCWGCYGVVLPVGSPSTPGAAHGRGQDDEKEEEDFGEIHVGDDVWVRWRPLDLDDEPERSKRWEEATTRRG